MLSDVSFLRPFGSGVSCYKGLVVLHRHLFFVYQNSSDDGMKETR